MSAVQLTEHVWLVGTADQRSPAFTNGYDCNQYLVRSADTAYAIDAGTGLGSARWLENLSEVVSLADVHGLVLTHYHADHAGGAAAAATAGLRVMGSVETASALAAGDEDVTQLARARDAGIYPSDYSLTAVDAVDELPDVYTLTTGPMTLTVLAAPGHCDGHLVVVGESEGARVLFSGDLVFAGGYVSMLAIPDCHLDSYAETILGLDELSVDRLYPGHGDTVEEGAYDDIGRAAKAFRSLIPPPNLLPAPGFE